MPQRNNITSTSRASFPVPGRKPEHFFRVSENPNSRLEICEAEAELRVVRKLQADSSLRSLVKTEARG